MEVDLELNNKLVNRQFIMAISKGILYLGYKLYYIADKFKSL